MNADLFDIVNTGDGIDSFIAKTLVGLGCLNVGEYGGDIVRLIRFLSIHPDADVSMLMSRVIDKSRSGVTYATVIRRVFDVNDTDLISKISRLTDSTVFSSVDAVCNLASYTRMEFFTEKAIKRSGM